MVISRVDIPLINLNAFISGGIDFNSGAVQLQGSVGQQYDFGPFSTRFSLAAKVSNVFSGTAVIDPLGPFVFPGTSTHYRIDVHSFGLNFSASGSASASISLPSPLCDPFISLSGSLAFAIGGSGFNISGSGNVSGGCGPISVGLGFSFHNNGFTVDLPGPFPDLNVSW